MSSHFTTITFQYYAERSQAIEATPTLIVNTCRRAPKEMTADERRSADARILTKVALALCRYCRDFNVSDDDVNDVRLRMLVSMLRLFSNEALCMSFHTLAIENAKFLDTEYYAEDAAFVECAILALDLDKPQSLLAAQEILSSSTVGRFHAALMQRDDEAQVMRNAALERTHCNKLQRARMCKMLVHCSMRCGGVYVPYVLEQIMDTFDAAPMAELRDISARDVAIYETPTGQLFDTSVLEA